jgi:TonB family protein
MKILNIIILLGLGYSVNVFGQEGLVKDFYPNDTLQSEINFSNNVRQGPAKFYYPNGKLKQELNYTDGKVEGVVKEYYENGNVKDVYTIQDGKRNGPESLFDENGKYLKDLNYDNGVLVREEAAAEDTTSKQAAQNAAAGKTDSLKNKTIAVNAAAAINQNESNPEYADTADVMPAPAGGIKTIMNNLVYPGSAKEKGIHGIVKIRAFVDEYGEVTKDEVVQGIGFGCDEAAKITVYYTQFTPGLKNGKPCKVQMVINVEFKNTNGTN